MGPERGQDRRAPPGRGSSPPLWPLVGAMRMMGAGSAKARHLSFLHKGPVPGSELSTHAGDLGKVGDRPL